MGKHNAHRTRRRPESAATARGASSREGIEPLERSKYHRRRLGTPPRRDAAMQVTDFLVFVPAPDQGFLEGTIYGESTVY